MIIYQRYSDCKNTVLLSSLTPNFRKISLKKVLYKHFKITQHDSYFSIKEVRICSLMFKFSLVYSVFAYLLDLSNFVIRIFLIQ